MSLPTGPLHLLAALLPVLFLLFAILKLSWGVAKAAPWAMALSGFLAFFLFRSVPSALLLEAEKGTWNAAAILLVIWPALFSYELSREAGTFEAIRRGIQSLTRHELLQILILGWVFPSFLQGITGFGVAVAVGAPLLLSIGMKPLPGIVTVLLCHVWGATFGTLALAWNALLEQSTLTQEEISRAALLAAAMIWVLNLACVLLCVWRYGGKGALREGLPAVALLSFIMGGGELLLAPLAPTVSCFLPSAAGLGAALLLSRTKKYRCSWAAETSGLMDRTALVKTAEEKGEEPPGASMSLPRAFLPYISLTVIAVACLLIPPVNHLLSQWKLSFSFPETITGYGFITTAAEHFSPQAPFTYAGTFLVLSALAAYLCYRRWGYLGPGSVQAAWRCTVKKCGASTAAILTLIIMSKFMSSSGMIYLLSQKVVGILGRFYLLAAPFFGMLGAFITSSNMSSNILMGGFQSTAASLLGVDPATAAALQTVGGILGNAFAPGCVIMGSATTGYTGGDASIIRKILPISLSCAAVFGFIGVWVCQRFW